MTDDTPLIPGSLYGLRTWRLGVDERGEYLTGAWQRRRWPCGGAWLEATCAVRAGHPAPSPACTCGVHAWHPRRRSARRVLAKRFEVAGIVEAAGAIELQDDGFRSERAKPYALVVAPGRNPGLVRRLAERYRAEVVEVANADALLAWCRERGLGLGEDTVAQLLGPEHLEQQGRLRRARRRRDVVGAVTAVAVSIALLAGGLRFASDGPADHRLFGRTGWVTPAAQRDARATHPGDRTHGGGPSHAAARARRPARAGAER